MSGEIEDQALAIGFTDQAMAKDDVMKLAKYADAKIVDLEKEAANLHYDNDRLRKKLVRFTSEADFFAGTSCD